MKSKLDDAYIQQFLDKNKLAVVSTVGTDGKPYAAPVYFTVDDSFVLHFITPEGTQKFKNLSKNPDVVLTIVNEQDWETLHIEGVATFDELLVPEVLDELAERLDDGESMLKKLPLLQYGDSKKTAVIISPKKIGIRRYSDEHLEQHEINF